MTAPPKFVMSQRPEEVTAAMDRLREVAFDICQEAINAGEEPHRDAADIFTLINEINDFRKAAQQ